MATAEHEVVLEGSLDEIQDYFEERQWKDGLPIIPPTKDRILSFLAHTPYPPEHSLGTMLPANCVATVWSVAVNGVMAGCRPEHMPILVAIVEAIADPQFRVQDGGSTPGWEPVVIVNGPIVQRLAFNCESGVMRTGRRANATVGRFVKLCMRNIAGIREGTTDKGTFGQNFYVAIAENEAAVAEIGWEPFSVDRGFAPGQSVVTVQSIVAASMPTYSAGDTAESHLSMLVDVIGRGVWSYWSCTGLWFRQYHPLLVLSPSVARVIAREGIGKAEIRRYFYDNLRLPAEAFERYAWPIGLTQFRLDDLVASGVAGDAFAGSDPERLVPIFLDTDPDIGIVVSGDPGRNQSKGFVQNHLQGPPVSRAVLEPDDSGA